MGLSKNNSKLLQQISSEKLCGQVDDDLGGLENIIVTGPVPRDNLQADVESLYYSAELACPSVCRKACRKPVANITESLAAHDILNPKLERRASHGGNCDYETPPECLMVVVITETSPLHHLVVERSIAKP
ncbi:MAG TPA: hypothetical protein VM425_13245 [Myxococcota bacterium]|nr:hypothetical protein [Myxococcota bacterium]